MTAAWIGIVLGVVLVVAVKLAEHRAPASPHIVCPHCLTRGTVKVTSARRKQGISGGKATAALFTLGTSTLATGLSRKVSVSHMHCETCGMSWDA